MITMAHRICEHVVWYPLQILKVLLSLHLEIRSFANQILVSSSTDFQSVVRTLVLVFH